MKRSLNFTAMALIIHLCGLKKIVHHKASVTIPAKDHEEFIQP